jgi:hypothetical protein
MVPRLGYLACTDQLDRTAEALQGANKQARNSDATAAQKILGPGTFPPPQMQLTLPLCYGGLGICQHRALHNTAARLSAKALTETAMTKAQERLRPPSSPLHQYFAAIWSDARQVVQTVEPDANPSQTHSSTQHTL